MNDPIRSSVLVARRGELMAELFLQELHPLFVARNDTADFGVDFFVGFENPKGGVNVVAVEIKATERPVSGRFRLPRRVHELLANSNIPGMLLVVDVKLNRYYLAELLPLDHEERKEIVSVPLAEVTEESRAALIKQFSGVLR